MIRLPDMAKIGIGAPSIIRKINLVQCTRTIYPTSIINGLTENRGRDKPKKGQVPDNNRL